MKQNTDGNGRINTAQRKVLANLAVEILNTKIQQARDESGEIVAQIKQKVREELGIAAMDIEIANMEKQIEALQKKREEVGFSKYNDGLLPGSQAKQLIDKRTNTASQKVRQLEEKKTDAISRIWTATTMAEALSVLDEAKKL